MPLALAVHGGAWNIPDDEVDAHLFGVAEALTQGWERLRAGGSALDVVETVVRVLEADPTFNAGRGSHLNSEGKLEMDASIMEGGRLRAGAVAAISGVRHPVSVARRLLEDGRHVLLAGAGAVQFAREAGAELCRPTDLLVGRELERFRAIRRGRRSLVRHEFRAMDTVGAVALDRRGRTAAATSTGGTQDKAPGRVGDSPIPGAGSYADDRRGAASCTGWGEGILRVVLAKTAVDLLAEHPADAAARKGIAALRRVEGHGGVILLDRAGHVGAAFNTPRMARGIATEGGGLTVGVERGRLRRA
ncbi:MAG TPA: isoaspartyl peptidase/L-asparaginase family protein [Candidatus Polarisedimenticolaceae bacterium]|nr:isoaspartyl peptidase/L-asparaginase family protein [Candidatus Polarisedimenticolaceae bacterium]